MNRTLAASLILILAGDFAAQAADTGTPGQNTHRLAGIGVVVGNDSPNSNRIHKFILIRALQDHSPAQEEGLQAGDEIVAIDNFKVAGLNVADAVNMRLRGEQDSVVQLTVKRPGQAKLLSFSLIRKIIPAEEGQKIQHVQPFSS